MASPRPYVAAAAASVLAALYFVPSASAASDHTATPAVAAQQQAGPAAGAGHHAGLADTGAFDTKPYVVGGAVFLVAGAGLIVDAGRRSRRDAATA